MHYDAVVVGLGPAGAHFSYIASKLGHNIVALERGSTHGAKTCAGGISPVSAKILNEQYKRIPSEVVERDIEGVSLETKTNTCRLGIPNVEAFTTRRANFDHWLINETIEKGTTVEENCRIKKIDFSQSCVNIMIRKKGSIRNISTDCVVGAYGAGSTIPRIIKLPTLETMIGIQCEMDLPADAIDGAIGNNLSFFYDSRFSSQGYAWIFPRKDSIAVGLLDDTPTKLSERLRSFIDVYHLAKRFRVAAWGRTRNKAALLPNEISPLTYRDRLLLIGDAAGFGDRITWEGIPYALRSADFAVKTFCLAHDRNDFSIEVMKQYEETWKSSFEKDLRYGKKLQKTMFDKDLDNNWSTVINLLNENKNLREFLIHEMQKHMSIARSLAKLPVKEKLLLLKHFGYKTKSLMFSKS